MAFTMHIHCLTSMYFYMNIHNLLRVWIQDEMNNTHHSCFNEYVFGFGNF